MDATIQNLHYPGMTDPSQTIPAFDLYGEDGAFPDLMHCERIGDRASGLDWTIPPHRHGVLHQFFHLDGTGARASVDGTQVVVDRPAILSIPRFHVHSFDFPPGQGGHVLSVRPDTLPDLFGPDADLPGALAQWRRVDATDDHARLFASIRDELTGAAPLRSAVLRARVVEIAAAVLRAASDRIAATTSDPALRHMRRFEALVQQTFSARHNVAWYAERIGVSPEHLGRVTRRYAGTSPARFIETRLMQEARRQLAYARTPVAGIGYGLGYDDPAYFSRVFRRHEGVSPSDYRRSRSDFT